MKKNNKGFTLVELLAVIVVLAIIMVIATQQISNVIKKNTVDSFKSSLDMVGRQAKNVFAQEGTINSVTSDAVSKMVDYDKAQYSIGVSSITRNVNGSDETFGVSCIRSGDPDKKGKFVGMSGEFLNTEFNKDFNNDSSTNKNVEFYYNYTVPGDTDNNIPPKNYTVACVEYSGDSTSKYLTKTEIQSLDPAVDSNNINWK